MATHPSTYDTTSRSYAPAGSRMDTGESDQGEGLRAIGFQGYLRANPGVAVLVAFCVGFLAARLIVGRK